MKIKITVKRITTYPDLMKEFENPILHACSLKENMVFYSDGKIPEGFCPEAFKILKPFIDELLCGHNNFYDGWMKNPNSAMISCNDGFRPVSFYIELVE